MNLLVDTHILLWSLNEPERLRPSHIDALESPESDVWVSALSLWEIAIKSQIGKLEVDQARLLHAIQDQGFLMLPFNEHHALATSNLPLHHRDPFDRGLLAQALVERFHVVSCDELLNQYKDVVPMLD